MHCSAAVSLKEFIDLPSALGLLLGILFCSQACFAPKMRTALRKGPAWKVKSHGPLVVEVHDGS